MQGNEEIVADPKKNYRVEAQAGDFILHMDCTGTTLERTVRYADFECKKFRPNEKPVIQFKELHSSTDKQIPNQGGEAQ